MSIYNADFKENWKWNAGKFLLPEWSWHNLYKSTEGKNKASVQELQHHCVPPSELSHTYTPFHRLYEQRDIFKFHTCWDKPRSYWLCFITAKTEFLAGQVAQFLKNFNMTFYITLSDNTKKDNAKWIFIVIIIKKHIYFTIQEL